ncbi:LptM family lipoprotein [Ruminococcus albus]|uniref:DUF5640 domain-containing protein n=1 Tax=Ruminococcus albus TaxID=1264 RepID=A0A1H7I5V5_RUMAL|nr:hypothetical protein [Ruminococcus albus]SEK57167.1 hypothetical protein SAMN05216469_103231 [Ruminococcus albus]
MKKQMIVIAMMSLIVTLAGCGAVNDKDKVNNGSTTEKSTVSETSSAEETSSQAENTTESSEINSDTDSKSDKKDDKTENKKVSAVDVSEIVGEWAEYGGAATRFLTINSDAGFEVKSDTGSLIASGTISVNTENGTKKYSFNDSEKGLWYVPFVYAPVAGTDFLQTEENSVYETIRFARNIGDPENVEIDHADFSAILGTWFEEDMAIGRTITVNDDGTYIVTFQGGSSVSGNVTVNAYDDNYYDFCDDGGLWYSFCVIGEGEDQQLYSPSNALEGAVSFGRSPSTASSSGAIDKIAGEWLPNDPTMDFTLVVNNDSTYTFKYNDGRTSSGNIRIEIRDGVEKYNFLDDNGGLWYVPFELRTAGQQVVLITEDNPVYEPVSFSR